MQRIQTPAMANLLTVPAASFSSRTLASMSVRSMTNGSQQNNHKLTAPSLRWRCSSATGDRKSNAIKAIRYSFRTPSTRIKPFGVATHQNGLQRERRYMRSFSIATGTTSGAEMKDEYGSLDSAGHTFAVSNWTLESGQVLPLAELRYQTYGQLNADRNNVIVVCHALTGNASLHAWWGGLLTSALQHVPPTTSVEDNATTITSSSSSSPYFVVCCNILGSCYGSTGPASINPETGQRYGRDFPDVSIRDTVRLQLQLLQQELKVSSVLSVIGGSFGGMQALEFAVHAGCATNTIALPPSPRMEHDQPILDAKGEPYVRTVIPIACGAQHTAWQIGISEVQRQAIYMDPAWNSDNPFAATSGLQVARQLGMLSYRTASAYQTKFGRTKATPASPAYGSQTDWQVKGYLEYQGRKFLSRLDPVSYVKLTEQMDSHDVTRSRGETVTDVLSQVTIPALVLGIDSDVLYPIAEQQDLAAALPQSTFHTIHSTDGHDGFLLEQDQVASHISAFLAHHDKI